MGNLSKCHFFKKIGEARSDIPQDSQDIQEKDVHQGASILKAVCQQ